MKEMTGTCPFCGQTQMVQAEDQQEADMIAARHCVCDNNLKRIALLEDNIDALCGEEIKKLGMDIVTEEVIDTIKGAGALCIYGHIDTASFRIADSSITIKKTKDGAACSRKKVLSVKLEA